MTTNANTTPAPLTVVIATPRKHGTLMHARKGIVLPETWGPGGFVIVWFPSLGPHRPCVSSFPVRVADELRATLNWADQPLSWLKKTATAFRRSEADLHWSVREAIANALRAHR